MAAKLTSYALEMADFVIMTDNGRMAVITPAVIKASDKMQATRLEMQTLRKVSGNAPVAPTQNTHILQTGFLLPDNNLTGATR